MTFTLHRSQFTTLLLLVFAIITNGFQHETEDEIQTESEETKTILLAMLITTFAGFAAFIGGLSIFCIKKEEVSVMPASLAFSSGVIIHLALINLIAECREELSHTNSSIGAVRLYVLLCVISGVLFTLAMEHMFKHSHADPHQHQLQEDDDDSVHSDNNESNSDHDTLKNEDVEEAPDTTKTNVIAITGEHKPVTSDAENMSQLSYSVAFALILHHFPEGIATFVSLYHNVEFGALVAFALAVHDIPSGICISVPLYVATGSKRKPFILCAIAAAVYPFGGFIGWVVIKTASETFIEKFIGILFGVTAGIMLYIGLVELLPNAILSAHRLESKGHKNIFGITISLVFAGLFVMNISDILLSDVIYHL